jgi:beta-glucanase (GH16 family)
LRARTSLRTLVTAVAVAGAAAAEGRWVLSYEEDFSANAGLNTGFWTTETGYQRNREAQYYTPSNVFVRDGRLVFEARREDVPNAAWRASGGGWRAQRKTARYTSGSIVSRGTVHYGRIEVVARTPTGAGLWPAIWLVHEDKGQYGEIDLYEAVGKHPDTAFAAIHWGSDPRTRKHRNASRQVPGLEGSWRTHSLEWMPDRIVIGLDGTPLFTVDPAEARVGEVFPLRLPMRLRINLALGGTWGGEIDDSRLPARFEVASIRMWRWDPAAASAPEARNEPAEVRPRWSR